jgi:hypothetical protein
MIKWILNQIMRTKVTIVTTLKIATGYIPVISKIILYFKKVYNMLVTS